MISKYWKAVVAFLTPLVVLLTTVANSPAIQAAAPGATAWLFAVGLPLLTGFITFMVRNTVTVETIDTALEKGDVGRHALKEIAVRADDRRYPPEVSKP